MFGSCSFTKEPSNTTSETTSESDTSYESESESDSESSSEGSESTPQEVLPEGTVVLDEVPQGLNLRSMKKLQLHPFCLNMQKAH